MEVPGASIVWRELTGPVLMNSIQSNISMHRTNLSFLSGLLLTTLFLTPDRSWAAVLASEDFGSHANNDPRSGSGDGTGWSSTWDGGGNQFYLNPGTNFAGATNVYNPTTSTYGANADGRSGRNFNTSPTGSFGLAGYLDGSGNIGANGTTLYVAWAMRSSSASHYWGFEFDRDGTGDGDRHLQISTDGPSGGNLWLRPNNDNGFASGIAASNTNINYFVLRLDFGASNNDTASLYYNPALNTAEGTPTAIVNAFDLSFDRIAIAKFNGGGNGTVDVENIRLATNYADVVGVPEPSGLALVGLAFGLSGVFARRRKTVNG